MSLVTVPQVNPNDEITALSVNQGSNAIAAVVNGNIDDTNISTVSGTKITGGTLPIAAFDTASNPETRESETSGDLVASGLVWSPTTGLSATMTSGVAYVSGKRLAVNTVASNAFTASRDTYVYIDSAGAVQYNAQTNGATQPVTPANNMLIAKVVTNGSIVTSVSDLRIVGTKSAWTTWTPSVLPISGTFTATSGTGKFSQNGKTVTYRCVLTVTTIGTGTGLLFTLPVVAAFSASPWGIGVGREDALTGNMAFVRVASTTTGTVSRYDNGNILSGGNGSKIEIWGSYEAL